MTTQRTSWALAREAAGLLLTAFGLLGVLLALGTLHWAAALSAASSGLIVLGRLLRPEPDASHLHRRALCAAAVTAGCTGLVIGAFSLSTFLGWLTASVAVCLHGLWLISHDDEGAA